MVARLRAQMRCAVWGFGDFLEIFYPPRPRGVAGFRRADGCAFARANALAPGKYGDTARLPTGRQASDEGCADGRRACTCTRNCCLKSEERGDCQLTIDHWIRPGRGGGRLPSPKSQVPSAGKDRQLKTRHLQSSRRSRLQNPQLLMSHGLTDFNCVPNRSQRFPMVPNGSEWFRLVPFGSQRFGTVPSRAGIRPLRGALRFWGRLVAWPPRPWPMHPPLRLHLTGVGIAVQYISRAGAVWVQPAADASRG